MSAHILVPTRLLEHNSTGIAAGLLPSGAAPLLVLGARRTTFRPGESLVVTMGAIALGGMAGLVLLFVLGRVAPGPLLTTAFAVYCCAIYLVSLSMRTVVHSGSTLPIALFGLHFACLLAWPMLATGGWTPASWQWWLGLPASLSALIAFLAVSRVSNSVVYRSSAHASLIASVAVYEYMWRVMVA